MKKKKIFGWGHYLIMHAEVESDLSSLSEHKMIPRGMGRSYGDAAMQSNIISTASLNQITEFNSKEQWLICQSSVTIKDLLEYLVPRGYFLSVIPGTKYVSLGGAIASDIHGKNHQTAGSFCNIIEEFNIQLASGEIRSCSRTENSELFWNTFGAMGLTGLIISAKVKVRLLENAYISVTTEKISGLKTFMKKFKNDTDEYSVAWIDTSLKNTVGIQGIYSSGNHTIADVLASSYDLNPLEGSNQRQLSIPFFFPRGCINRSSIKLFNKLRLWKAPLKKKEIVHYESFFFPLDRIGNWYRLYGRNGFIQYQGVFPLAKSEESLKKIFSLLKEHGIPSSLAVLKLHGAENKNSPLSFPMPGYSLALDFPRNKKTIALVRLLYDLTYQSGGRIYLAKDALLNRKQFEPMYPNLKEFRNFIELIDPTEKFQSLQSSRIGLK